MFEVPFLYGSLSLLFQHVMYLLVMSYTQRGSPRKFSFAVLILAVTALHAKKNVPLYRVFETQRDETVNSKLARLPHPL